MQVFMDKNAGGGQRITRRQESGSFSKKSTKKRLLKWGLWRIQRHNPYQMKDFLPHRRPGSRCSK
jgi:hypothetical protein